MKKMSTLVSWSPLPEQATHPAEDSVVRRTCQQRCSQRLPEVEALGEAQAVVDEVGHDVLGQQPDEVGDDQTVDLEARHQQEGQHDAHQLLRRHQDGFEVGAVGGELDVVAHPRGILDRPPDDSGPA